MSIFNKKNENKSSEKHYLTGKEIREIAKANAKVMKELEKKKYRKADESEFVTCMDDDSNILEIEDLHTYFFTDQGVVKAVNGVSFNIPKGATVGIVGESGCGKSVTSMSVMRLLQGPQGQIYSGSIRFKAYDYKKDEAGKLVPVYELDENGEFLRFYGDGSGAGEAIFYAYSSSQKVNTGKYIAVKYRMPSTNTEGNYLQIFASTVHKAADATDSIYLSSTTKVKDDAWHVIVIDAASFLSANYAPEGGRYYCNYIRFDVFNVAMSQTSYIDVAYIGIGDDLDKIRQLDANAELDTLMLITKVSSSDSEIR